MTEDEFKALRPGDTILYKGEPATVTRLSVTQIDHRVGIVFTPANRKTPIAMYNHTMIEKHN